MDLTSQPVPPEPCLLKNPSKVTVEAAGNGARMASIQDDDELLLARIGYKQVKQTFYFVFEQDGSRGSGICRRKKTPCTRR